MTDQSVTEWDADLTPRRPAQPVLGPDLIERMTSYYAGDPCGSVSTAIGAAPTTIKVPDVASSALLTVEGAAVRMTLSGTDPTAAVGLLLPVGTLLRLNGRPTLQGAKFFQVAAGAIVQAEFFD